MEAELNTKILMNDLALPISRWNIRGVAFKFASFSTVKTAKPYEEYVFVFSSPPETSKSSDCKFLRAILILRKYDKTTSFQKEFYCAIYTGCI